MTPELELKLRGTLRASPQDVVDLLAELDRLKADLGQARLEVDLLTAERDDAREERDRIRTALVDATIMPGGER